MQLPRFQEILPDNWNDLPYVEIIHHKWLLLITRLVTIITYVDHDNDHDILFGLNIEYCNYNDPLFSRYVISMSYRYTPATLLKNQHGLGVHFSYTSMLDVTPLLSKGETNISCRYTPTTLWKSGWVGGTLLVHFQVSGRIVSILFWIVYNFSLV